jgi:restriction endonuclease Mrr
VTVPDYQSFMRPLLAFGADGQEGDCAKDIRMKVAIGRTGRADAPIG